MKNLQNKRIVIVGGTSGIGLTTATMLAAEGAEVIISGRDEAKLRQAIKESGASPLSQSVNASDRNQLDSFFKSIGNFDHLIITVSGGKGAGAFKDLNLGDLHDGFEDKFWPQLNTLQSALPYLSNTGSATLITAVSATSGKPGFSGLAAINGAIEIMIPVWAKELQPLRINAISPGVIDTSWWNAFPADVKNNLFEQFAAETPAGRNGKPEDIAKAIMFMIEQSFITGRVLQVDGGFGL
ncbi:SDR family oxidoreductase [Mucilaginibacter jinjuensis]|uniref:SDR family oxidoreductase n=1 Tax=Mucilaginibacter jinjuensis TaxID=1176721 RepID=A0ABY7T5E9_9SPHI|nr:SDR family oxidoreductase [Mucilaginibacter jinjuensis]WCT11597.1 SDR family oxidoreductase [Mucilaginibacter jinjuensis]